MTDVTKKYDREVLQINKLVLTRGLIYGLIGPSGAGKSTLLQIMNLLVPSDSGTILYHGKSAPAKGPERLALQRKMALVFQKNHLFRDSVWNNVAYGLKARRYPRPVIEKRVNTLLDQVGMKDLALQRADTLSGGEAQRVAIARAVAFEPELLLLDEPTANLDPGNIELIENMILKLVHSKDITVVMVTHNVFQARRIADRVIFINQGKIVEMGPTEKMFNEPDCESTRLFVEGRMVY
ncbi:MAG: phosphate ABC transporter ATP-binding protein [Bacillota bacterium]